jgi:hypothetical protein
LESAQADFAFSQRRIHSLLVADLAVFQRRIGSLLVADVSICRGRIESLVDGGLAGGGAA